MYLSLAWRNIWRNRNRTLIAAASVFLAVIMAILMRSAQNGSYAYMIDSSAKMFTGHLQLQDARYWDKRSLDHSFVLGPNQIDRIEAVPHIANVTQRLETFSLVSFGDETKVAQIIGIDPEAEDRITKLSEQIVKGTYLSDSVSGVILGTGLAERLQTDVGQSVIIFGQGYHGQTAAAELPVVGIVKLRFNELNNTIMYLPLGEAQEIFSMPERITSLPIIVEKVRYIDSVTTALSNLASESQRIMAWDEMLPEVKQSIMLDNAGGMIMLIILYIVITFGVFGTVMMMVSERVREFAILVSVGMKKYRLILVTTIESIMVSFIGMVIGVILAIPVVWYMYLNPIRISGEAAKAFEDMGVEAIFAFSNDPGIFLNQAFIVFLIALGTAVYPLYFIKKLEPADAIRA